MKTEFIGIFNTYCLDVRNNFLTHTHTHTHIFYTKKQIINKPSGFLFLLYYILYFIFTCISESVCAASLPLIAPNQGAKKIKE